MELERAKRNDENYVPPATYRLAPLVRFETPYRLTVIRLSPSLTFHAAVCEPFPISLEYHRRSEEGL
jgi:hypothetical protein